MMSDNQLFNEKGYLSTNISHLFGSAVKQIMYSAQSSKEDAWTYIFKNSIEQNDLSYSSPKEQVCASYAKCFEDYCNNKFSFFFRRLLNETVEGVPPCDTAKIAFEFCDSSTFKQLLAEYTGREIGNVEVFYINRFDKDHFLNTHTDSGNNVGVALNITQDWDPNFGGLTHILDNTHKRVIDTLTPHFGELFLFDTAKAQTPHFVSMVTTKQKNRRMSVVARYGKR